MLHVFSMLLTLFVACVQVGLNVLLPRPSGYRRDSCIRHLYHVLCHEGNFLYFAEVALSLKLQFAISICRTLTPFADFHLGTEHCKLIPLQNLPTLGGDKVSMLTHTYPHKLPRKIIVVICNHQAGSLFHLLPNVCCGDL